PTDWPWASECWAVVSEDPKHISGPPRDARRAQNAEPREALLVGEAKILFDRHHWNDRMSTAILGDQGDTGTHRVLGLLDVDRGAGHPDLPACALGDAQHGAHDRRSTRANQRRKAYDLAGTDRQINIAKTGR